MRIKPRADLKRIKPLFDQGTERIDEAIPRMGKDIIQEACDFHKIKRKYVEKVKYIDDNIIVLSLRPPLAKKLRYERR